MLRSSRTHATASIGSLTSLAPQPLSLALPLRCFITGKPASSTFRGCRLDGARHWCPLRFFTATPFVREVEREDNRKSSEQSKKNKIKGKWKWLNDWKQITSSKYLKEDLAAGLTLTMVAMPLNLAIALGSGVPAELGLVTGVLAGGLGALFGGTKLGVSGPAAAMSMLVCHVVRDYGLTGLALTTLMCGGLQLLTGALKAGWLIKFVPSPLIAGFMGGIGALILTRNATSAVGLVDNPEGSLLMNLFSDPTALLNAIHMPSLGLAGITLATAMLLPKLYPRAPAIMISVAATTLLQAGFQFHGVEMVGALPSSLPAPSLPQLPLAQDIGNIALMSLIFYGIASLESLLSSSALDKLSNARKPYDSNRELIAQGLSNVTCSFFGGLPATSVIARSSLSVLAGAKTRRAALIQAGMLLASVYLLSPLFAYIPIPTLSGVLMAAGLRMMHPAEIKHVYSISPIEVLPAAITFAMILSGDLITGVGVGLASSLAVNYLKPEGRKALRWNLSNAEEVATHDGDSVVPFQKKKELKVTLAGTVNFLSSLKVEKLHQEIASACSELSGKENDEDEEEENGTEERNIAKKDVNIVIDMKETHWMDATGTELFAKMVTDLRLHGYSVTIVNASPLCERLLLQCHVPPSLLQ